jgi:hypothetical protein
MVLRDRAKCVVGELLCRWAVLPLVGGPSLLHACTPSWALIRSHWWHGFPLCLTMLDVFCPSPSSVAPVKRPANAVSTQLVVAILSYRLFGRGARAAGTTAQTS